MSSCVGPCTYGQGSVVWHAVTDDDTTVAVTVPDRGDTAPVDVYRRGVLVPVVARHVAVGGHCWTADPCQCRNVRPEARPTYRRHLQVVAS